MSGTLVVVPCGRRKIWDVDPNAGPTAARDVYQGAPFKVNKEYAERFADVWLILSAKYGFVEPDFTIPENYDVTFSLPETGPVTIGELRRQARDKHLHRFATVVALGSTTYAEIVFQALKESGTRVIAPVAGLSLGRAIGGVRRAIDEKRPFM